MTCITATRNLGRFVGAFATSRLSHPHLAGLRSSAGVVCVWAGPLRGSALPPAKPGWSLRTEGRGTELATWLRKSVFMQPDRVWVPPAPAVPASPRLGGVGFTWFSHAAGVRTGTAGREGVNGRSGPDSFPRERAGMGGLPATGRGGRGRGEPRTGALEPATGSCRPAVRSGQRPQQARGWRGCGIHYWNLATQSLTFSPEMGGPWARARGWGCQAEPLPSPTAEPGPLLPSPENRGPRSRARRPPLPHSWRERPGLLAPATDCLPLCCGGLSGWRLGRAWAEATSCHSPCPGSD